MAVCSENKGGEENMLRRPASVVMIALALSAVLAAQALGGAGQFTILLSMKGPGSGNPFWAAVERGAREAAKRLNVNLVVLAPPAETDGQAQVAQMEDH